MATETTAATPKKRGFRGLPCVKCGETDTVSVDLDNVDNFRCTAQGCEEAFDADDVRNLIAAWTPVLVWLDTAPEIKE